MMRRWQSPRTVLAIATVVAAVATAGSLWLSLGLGLVPCELCWYQRILLYPLVVVLGVATYEGRPAVWRTVVPLAGLGGAIAAYHSYLQRFALFCGFDGCATIQYTVGPLSIPNLSLLAFALLLLLVGVVAPRTAVTAEPSSGA